MLILGPFLQPTLPFPIPHIETDLSAIKDYLKRIAEGEDSSGSRKKTSDRNNAPFRKRLIERDVTCVITSSHTFEAAHIIPHSFWKNHHPAWVKLYQQFCIDPSHEVDDVRNGLLLSPTLHTQFDQYLFTIIFENEKYCIKKSPFFHIPDLQETQVHFNGLPQFFPSPEFLAYHNEKFKEKVRNACGEVESSSSPDSGNSIVHHFETLDERKRKWIENVMIFEKKPIEELQNITSAH